MVTPCTALPRAHARIVVFFTVTPKKTCVSGQNKKQLCRYQGPWALGACSSLFVFRIRGKVVLQFHTQGGYKEVDIQMDFLVTERKFWLCCCLKI